MHTRGWQGERSVDTCATTGRPVPITTGVTHDERGAWVAAMAVGIEATAIINKPAFDKLVKNMHAAIAFADRRPRTIWTRDTLGRDVRIKTGRTRTAHDDRVVAYMEIGGVQAAAVITDAIQQRLKDNLDAAVTAAADLRRGVA